ncbi:RRM domain-containing protein [Plasmodiophora brassicae]|uniref:RRM domain-containing protein n=1 Tax=Plasmodiophora brassicae TaxID=37360 RepID=A0A0G4IK28_PLABS|nr:hypothetical protein PBRA_004187 [Plasmodiophora brassicae]SPR00333.1 unnamed protein product [Plasmodiophora brassicae]
MSVIQPGHTLYLNNLNEKISKKELKKALYELCGQFGSVIDIVALKTPRMRGQAFVLFDEINSAIKAHRDLQNFELFGKPIRANFAKTKSDYIAKRDGTFVPQNRKPHTVGPSEREREESADGTPRLITGADLKQPPNPILFVQNLPTTVTEGAVAALFEQYRGYREVRLIPQKPGIAFVEFEDEFASGQAMEALQGFKFTPVNPLTISFAKK